jgi:chromosome segregation ATPase
MHGAENGAEGDEQFNYDALTQYVNKLRQLNASLHNDINKNAMEKRVLCEKLLEAQEREINLSKQLSQRTNEMAELSEQIDIMILELETTQKKEVQQLQKSVDSLKSELAAQKRHAAASKFQNVTAAAPCLASALEMDAAQKNRLRDATSHTLEVGSAFATMAPSSNSNITISFKQPNSTTSWNGAEFFNRVQSFLESTFVESD